jgi:hypothetical protein
MPANKEIQALIKLIDDPDEVVYENVHNKIISIGSVIIPELEHCWENSNNTEVQQRLESIIHQSRICQVERTQPRFTCRCYACCKISLSKLRQLFYF